MSCRCIVFMPLLWILGCAKLVFFFVCLFHLASNVVKDCNELSSFLVHEKLRIVTKAQNEERLLYSIA